MPTPLTDRITRRITAINAELRAIDARRFGPDAAQLTDAEYFALSARLRELLEEERIAYARLARQFGPHRANVLIAGAVHAAYV